MPAPGLATLAKKYGVTPADAEKHWDQAKEYCQGKGYTGDRLYQCTMGVTREILKKKKESRFDITQKLDKANINYAYIENLHPEINGIEISTHLESAVYIVPDEIYEIVKNSVYGDKISERLLQLLEKKKKKKIIVREKKPKVKKIVDMGF